MLITINQGRPRSPYFLTAESPRNANTLVGDMVQCIHPKTKTVTNGQAVANWTFEWDDAPSGLLLLGYGLEPAALRKGLISTDNAFEDEWVNILLIRETI